jgi:enhancing lycopene biosynthesis protein 2
MKLKIGVVLSGCGFLDGSEIHEAVLTMLHLDRHDVEIVCMAPSGAQAEVVDHVQEAAVAGASRSMLAEAARIARGKIRPLAEVGANDLHAVVFPGGFGAAKNLCDFAGQGPAATANPEVAALLRAMRSAGKPIGAVCIAPALVAVVLGKEHPRLTVGEDAGVAAALQALGAEHVPCKVTDCVVDERLRIVSTPAYMYEARLSEVYEGIGKLVDAVVRMAGGGR